MRDKDPLKAFTLERLGDVLACGLALVADWCVRLLKAAYQVRSRHTAILSSSMKKVRGLMRVKGRSWRMVEL